MRRRIGWVAAATATAVAIVGALGGAVSLPASANEPPRAGEAAVAGAGGVTDITVGSARNQATGDVLGLGYEQVVRIEGSEVVIAEPTTRGGAVLRRFEAGLDTAWPREVVFGPITRGVFYGGDNLADVVHQAASRIAVLEDQIYVSRLRVLDRNWDRAAGSIVTAYSADGVELTSREFKTEFAVTALDAYEHEGKRYLAIGLNKTGVRVVKADEAGLPDFREVGTDWDGHGAILPQRDQVTVVKLGTDATGRLTLVAGRITYKANALVASDLHPEAGDGGDAVRTAAKTLWQNNWRDEGAHGKWWQYPDLVDFGRLGAPGAQGRQLVAVGWPSIGRVSFVDAETGADWTWTDGPAGAHALRFFTGHDGTGYIAIARDGAGGTESYTIAIANERGEWITVRQGRKDDLPRAIAELTTP